jgi:hypothetical protein
MNDNNTDSRRTGLGGGDFGDGFSNGAQKESDMGI